MNGSLCEALSNNQGLLEFKTHADMNQTVDVAYLELAKETLGPYDKITHVNTA